MKIKSTKKYWVTFSVIFGLCIFIKPALCFLLIGFLVSFFGILAIAFLIKIKKKGIDCIGNIIGYETDSDGDKTPMIEFITFSGEIINERPFIFATTNLNIILPHKNSINQAIPILYDPDDPKKFVLKNDEGLNYFVFILFTLSGIFFVGLSIRWLLGYIDIG